LICILKPVPKKIGSFLAFGQKIASGNYFLKNGIKIRRSAVLGSATPPAPDSLNEQPDRF
jgi:hypothetical protein